MVPWFTQAVPITELHRVRQWHLEHALDHPVEYQLWDAVLTSWLMGWVGRRTLLAGHAGTPPVYKLARTGPCPASAAVRLAQSAIGD